MAQGDVQGQLSGIAVRRRILFFIRLAFIPLIAGISYEFLKLSAKYEHNSLMRLFILPGLLMQKITTKEPNKKQIEVAMEAVKKIRLEELLDIP